MTLPQRIFQCQFVRWKGHNKWSNIKHTKGAKDAEYAKMSMRYSFFISRAIKENGNIMDPERNKALAKVIKEATVQGMAKASIENSIKKSQQATDMEATFEIRAPGRVGLLVQMQGSNTGNMQSALNSITKKNGGVVEQGIANMFEKKGVIVISKEESSLEQLEDDAIEFGAEDIEEFDDSFTLTCSPDDFTEVLSRLKEKYPISYA